MQDGEARSIGVDGEHRADVIAAAGVRRSKERVAGDNQTRIRICTVGAAGEIMQGREGLRIQANRQVDAQSGA